LGSCAVALELLASLIRLWLDVDQSANRLEAARVVNQIRVCHLGGSVDMSEDRHFGNI
jgi:hypothetical protein